MNATTWNRRSGQAGASVIEFAFVLPIFILILYGMITFGMAFYTQLAISRAAEDGARVAMGRNATDAQIKAEVVNSLAASAIAPKANSSNYTTRRTWLQTQLAAVPPLVVITRDYTCTGAGSTGSIAVRVNFPYSREAGTRLLPSLIGEWLPSRLVSCAGVQL